MTFIKRIIFRAAKKRKKKQIWETRTLRCSNKRLASISSSDSKWICEICSSLNSCMIHTLSMKLNFPSLDLLMLLIRNRIFRTFFDHNWARCSSFRSKSLWNWSSIDHNFVPVSLLSTFIHWFGVLLVVQRTMYNKRKKQKSNRNNESTCRSMSIALLLISSVSIWNNEHFSHSSALEI